MTNNTGKQTVIVTVTHLKLSLIFDHFAYLQHLNQHQEKCKNYERKTPTFP